MKVLHSGWTGVREGLKNTGEPSSQTLPLLRSETRRSFPGMTRLHSRGRNRCRSGSRWCRPESGRTRTGFGYPPSEDGRCIVHCRGRTEGGSDQTSNGSRLGPSLSDSPPRSTLLLRVSVKDPHRVHAGESFYEESTFPSRNSVLDTRVGQGPV